MSYLNGLVVFPTFFNLSLNLAIKSLWSEPQLAPSLVFADCIELLHCQSLSIDQKRAVFFPIPKKGDAKECPNYCKIGLISHASKVMLKNFQVRLQQFMKPELPDVQAGLEKAEEPEIKQPTFVGSQKKQENARKTSASLTTLKPLTMQVTTNCGKLKRWEYQTTLPAS